jgi:hypothetical protein
LVVVFHILGIACSRSSTPNGIHVRPPERVKKCIRYAAKCAAKLKSLCGTNKEPAKNPYLAGSYMAPDVGLEPTTR